MDAFEMHMENRVGCNDDGFEPEAEELLRESIAAAHSQLYVTTVSEVRE